MKTKLFLLVILSTFGVELLAQGDYSKGYYTTYENDTIYGLLKKRSDLGNTYSLIFKKEEGSEATELTANVVSSYRFENGRYFVAMNSLKNFDQKIFYEFVLNGVIDLYYYYEDGENHYFIKKEGEKLVELKNTRKVIEKYDESDRLKESKEYIGVLKYFMNDGPKASKKIKNLSLNHKSLINISKDYHDEVCTDEECIVYEMDLSARKIIVNVVGGVRFQASEFNKNFNEETNPTLLGGYKFEKNQLPYLGIQIKFPLNQYQSIYFDYEADLYPIKMSALKSTTWPTYEMIETVEVSRIILSNNFLANFYLSRKKITPYFTGGLYANVHFNDKLTKYNKRIWNNPDIADQKTQEEFATDKAYSIGLKIGAGVMYKTKNKRNIEFAFLYSSPFVSRVFNALIKSKTVQLRISYPIN